MNVIIYRMIFGQINISNELLILYLIPHCIFKKSMSFYILNSLIIIIYHLLMIHNVSKGQFIVNV